MKKLMLLAAVLALCLAAARSQSVRRSPNMGYLYPGGGEQGKVVYVLVGGQNLWNASKAYITGEGVKVTVVRYLGRVRRLNGEERKEVKRRLDLLKAAGADRYARSDGADGAANAAAKKTKGKKGKNDEKAEDPKDQVKLPNHPLLNALDSLTPVEIEFLENEFFKFNRKAQPNSQIAETVLLKVTIARDALPGDREIRLQNSLGLTNPMCFQVGVIPEFKEEAPYDNSANAKKVYSPPVLLNGQIKPGDIDRFKFRAKKDEQLVIEVVARHLVPYLADAVPGWFQATVSLFDPEGREVAYADDFRFNPDPVLFFKIPETGVYELEIRDSIYRGREDFVYRITIAEKPFIKSLFPLGGKAGEDVIAAIDGWNLPVEKLTLDTHADGSTVRRTAINFQGRISNCVPYGVGELTETFESEPNDTIVDAPLVKLPQVVNGRIGVPGDKDLFRFRGRGGETIIVEVFARRLHSPLDSLLRITDEKGKMVAWNDDYVSKEGFLHKGIGILTHYADSYLAARLPRSEIFTVHLIDFRGHGGKDHGYRLRISRPQPDFTLHMTPSSITMRARSTLPVTVHVLRKDGFTGAVDLALKESLEGFVLHGGRIPKNQESVRVTLTAPTAPLEKLVTLELVGSARIGGKMIERPVIPAEEKMQAFLFRHLVPSQEMKIAVNGWKNRTPLPEIASKLPLRIKPGRSARIRIDIPKRNDLAKIFLKLDNPPKGVTLHDVKLSGTKLTFRLKADRKEAPRGVAGNLIVEAFMERKPKKASGKEKTRKPPAKPQKVSLGYLPAIPFEIARR